MTIATDYQMFLAKGEEDQAKAFVGMKNMEIIGHIKKFREFDDKVLADLSVGDLLTVSDFSLSLGYQEEAIALATQALMNADDDVYRAEAMRYRAGVTYSKGDFQNLVSARKDMKDALSLVIGGNSAPSVAARTNILGRLIPLMPGLLHLVGRCLRGGRRSFVAGTCE